MGRRQRESNDSRRRLPVLACNEDREAPMSWPAIHWPTIRTTPGCFLCPDPP